MIVMSSNALHCRHSGYFGVTVNRNHSAFMNILLQTPLYLPCRTRHPAFCRHGTESGALELPGDSWSTPAFGEFGIQLMLNSTVRPAPGPADPSHNLRADCAAVAAGPYCHEIEHDAVDRSLDTTILSFGCGYGIVVASCSIRQLVRRAISSASTFAILTWPLTA